MENEKRQGLQKQFDAKQQLDAIKAYLLSKKYIVCIIILGTKLDFEITMRTNTPVI